MRGFDLPEEWCLTKIGDVCSKITDGSHNPPKASTEGLPMLSAKNINNGMVDFNLEHRLIPYNDFLVEDKRTNIQVDDVLLTIVGALGRSALVVKEYAKFTLQRSVAVLAAPHLDAKCFRYSLEEYQFQKQVLDNAKGTAQKGIYLKKLSELTLPIPPLAEQKEIADRLDNLLAQVEATQASLANIPNIIKQFRQSALAAAVSGKLTEEWRISNLCSPAINILMTLGRARLELIKKGQLKKSVSTKPLEIHGDIKTPKTWSVVNFEHIAAYDNNALKAGPFGSALKKADCVDSGYKVYGQEQVISGDEALETYFINESKFKELSSCAVSAGDILISLVGTIGKVLVLSSRAKQGIINPRLVKLSLHEKVNRDYIKLYLESPVAVDFFKGFSHGGTMDILNLGILKDLPIRFPPIEEQVEIVRRVEQLFAYADSIEQQAKAAKERVDNLTQAILAKAFRGELTADWRAANPDLISGDNSAAALLARIQAKRAQTTKKGRKRTQPAP